jgi:16S rRNA G966 N2-methylase RsmD
MDYLDAMKKLAAGKETFDIIFADPPYQSGYYETIMKKTVDLGLLNEYGVLVLEHDSKEIFPPAEGLTLVSRRKYGRRSLMILSVEGDEKINETDLSGKL